jgi:hypothetical protein
VVAIAHELETWTREQPFSRPTSYPLPHVLLMHMMSHLIQIYLFRPYYRSQLDISPTPAERCGQAAESVAELLRVSEQRVFTMGFILDRSSCMTRNTACGTEWPRSVSYRVLYSYISVRDTVTDPHPVPIVFGAATVYLLRLVSNEVEPRDLNNLEESVSGTPPTRRGMYFGFLR